MTLLHAMLIKSSLFIDMKFDERESTRKWYPKSQTFDEKISQTLVIID